jgi:hypothetical protein
MAITQWYRYDFLDATGFLPGQTRVWRHTEQGSFWFGKAVVVSAQPFDASDQSRALAVTEIIHGSTGAGPGQRYLEYAIRNVGVDSIVIYYVFIGIVSE